MMNRLNRFLFLALVVVLAPLALMRVDHSRPNFQIVFGNDMTYSPAYGAYSANPNFANGRTIQEPITGTLARSESRFDFLATPEDALRAGEQLISPYSKSADENNVAADRGAVVFQTFCTSCHGGDANGNGPVAQRGFPPPPSLLTGKSRDMKDGQLFHILTLGQNNMPNFAVQLPPSRRWDVIAYIRRLQHSAQPPASSVPPATPTAPTPAPTVVPPTAVSTTPTAEQPAGEPKQ
ncbi:MAG: cytochrome c [Pirellulales bacterium]